jgi:hypothetical protein
MTFGPAASTVRHALSFELESRGYLVADDTVSLRGELYVRGDGDRVAALFEFKSTAEEAARTMYQGSWSAELPPRFAVMPVSQKEQVEIDLLHQAGLKTLFYETAAEAMVFADLDAALDVVDARVQKAGASEVDKRRMR